MAGATAEKVNTLCQWRRLPTKGLPLLFVGVEGKDERTLDSPGFMNRHVAPAVV